MATLQHTWSAPDVAGRYDLATVCALVADRPAFAALPRDVGRRLAMFSRVRPFPDGHALLRAGEAGERAYLVLRGRVRLERPHADPVEVGPGTLLAGLPDDATGDQPLTARALGAVEALTISHVALGLTMMQYPEAEETLRAAFRD